MKRLIIAFVLMLSCALPATAGSMVNYTINGEAFEGYFTSPADNAPLVVIIHDWDGLTDYEITRANMLHELGYAAFAADLYGAGVRPTKTEDKRSQTQALYTNRERMRTLMYGALKVADKLGADTANAVAIGYCFGGASVLELARSGMPMKGFVSFHGGLTTPEGQGYADTNGFVLVLHGTADTAVTMQDFANLAVEMEEAGVAHEMTTYSGAPHAFTVIGSTRYHPEADRQSWARLIRFLGETLN